jgi:hypothetical protein
VEARVFDTFLKKESESPVKKRKKKKSSCVHEKKYILSYMRIILIIINKPYMNNNNNPFLSAQSQMRTAYEFLQGQYDSEFAKILYPERIIEVNIPVQMDN